MTSFQCSPIYNLSTGLPWFFSRVVPESSYPRGLRALLLLAEQSDGVLSGGAVPQRPFRWSLQRSHERHLWSTQILPEGNRVSHGQDSPVILFLLFLYAVYYRLLSFIPLLGYIHIEAAQKSFLVTDCNPVSSSGRQYAAESFDVPVWVCEAADRHSSGPVPAHLHLQQSEDQPPSCHRHHHRSVLWQRTAALRTHFNTGAQKHTAYCLCSCSCLIMLSIIISRSSFMRTAYVLCVFFWMYSDEISHGWI